MALSRSMSSAGKRLGTISVKRLVDWRGPEQVALLRFDDERAAFAPFPGTLDAMGGSRQLEM